MADRPFSYTVRRDPRRRHPQLAVTPEGEVVVKLPQRFSGRYAEKLVDENTGWILAALARAAEKRPPETAFACGEGDALPLLGVSHPVYASGPRGYRDGAFYLPGGTVEERMAQAEETYRELAGTLLPTLAARYGEMLGLRPAGIKIGRANGSWGYCKRDGRITFTWRLVCQPEDFVRYVVVHELCHLAHFDHSPAFWEMVGRAAPDWKALRHDPRVQAIARQMKAWGF